MEFLLERVGQRKAADAQSVQFARLPLFWYSDSPYVRNAPVYQNILTDSRCMDIIYLIYGCQAASQ